MFSPKISSSCSLLILSMLVILVSVECLNVTTTRPITSETNCSTLLGPATNQVFQGVDITDFDLLPLIGLSSNLKEPIFENTKTCILFDYDTDTDDPDGPLVIELEDNESFATSYDTATVTSNETITDLLNVQIGLFGEIYDNKEFSQSPSYKTIRDDVNNGRVFVEITKKETQFYIFSTLNLKLHPDFVNRINGLNATYDKENQAAYFKFIHSFGTHFISSAHFGKVKRIYATVDKKYYDRQYRFYVVEVLRKAIMSDEVPTFDNAWKAKVSQRTYGDDVTPRLFQTDVEPIYKHFKDEQKKQSMKRAVEAYVDLRYLDD